MLLIKDERYWIVWLQVGWKRDTLLPTNIMLLQKERKDFLLLFTLPTMTSIGA